MKSETQEERLFENVALDLDIAIAKEYVETLLIEDIH